MCPLMVQLKQLLKAVSTEVRMKQITRCAGTRGQPLCNAMSLGCLRETRPEEMAR